MQIEIFCLCDAATENFGKMNILGAFDTIFAQQVPFVHPQCTLALRLRFNTMEIGTHDVQVNFVDADGVHVIPPANGQLKINQAGSTHLILNIQGLKILKVGQFAIDLLINAKNCASLPLFVRIKE